MAQMSASDLPRIGDVIRAWRIFRGLRSTKLAARAGVRSQYLSEIEHNRTNNPKEDYLKKLADALGVPLKDILGRRMPPEEGEDDEVVKSKQQVVDPPLPTMANAIIRIPDLLLQTIGDQINEIKRLIDSLSLTDEEEAMIASQLDTTERLLKFIAAQRKTRKEG